MTDRPQSASDMTQLASMRTAISSVERNQALSPAEREYHKRVLQAVVDRIEDAMDRKAAKQRQERG